VQLEFGLYLFSSIIFDKDPKYFYLSSKFGIRSDMRPNIEHIFTRKMMFLKITKLYRILKCEKLFSGELLSKKFEIIVTLIGVTEETGNTIQVL
jgi:hypothetical protein